MSKERIDRLTRAFLDAREALRHYVSRRIGPEEAEDVVQETWLRLSQHAHPESWQEPRAFLFTTAGNLAIDRWRWQQRRHGLFEETDILPPCPRPGPEQQYEQLRQVERLSEALGELPEACRQAFLLNRVEGLSHGEIARRLGISGKTVQRHIERALGHCLIRLAD